MTAGKIFRFKIPIETFADAEDGNTRQLQLELTSMDGREMTEISWIAFNDTTQVKNKKQMYRPDNGY